MTKECINYIKNEGFDPQFGARPLKRVIRRKIMDARSLAMLEDKISSGASVIIDAIDNKIVLHEKPKSTNQLIDF